MKEESKVAVPSRETAYARAMTYLIVALVVVVGLPVYVYHNYVLLRAAANSPVSRVLLFGEPLDPVEMASRLNADGKLVDMTDVLASVQGRQCASGDSPFPKGQQTAVKFSLDDGTERHAVVYVPSSYPNVAAAAAAPVAMLVLYHGLNDNCEHFLNATGFMPHAEKHGFVIVSACGSQGYLGTAWNSGMCCGFSGDKPNDVNFAQVIVEEMSAAVCVDPRKVMAVGFSNGAMLSEVLACEAPEVYRAVASIGGVVELRPGNEAGLAKCTEKVQSKANRTSVLMVHGTSDVMVPWRGNKLLGFPSVEANVAGWAERNDCETAQTTTTINTTTYTNTIYAACNAAATRYGMSASILVKEGDAAPAVEEKPLATMEQQLMMVEALAEEEMPTLVVLPEDAGVQFNKRHGHGEGSRKRHGPKRRKDGKEEEEEKDKKNKKGGKKHGRDKKHEEEEEHHRRHKHPERKPHDGEGERHRRGGRRGRGHAPPGHPHPHHHHPRHGGGGCGRGHGRGGSGGVRGSTEAGDAGVSQVELVKVNGGAHSWPHDSDFSTTDYIVKFGGRVFGGYN